jgi:hypothetical protein
MAMIGRPAARAPLSTADITDGIITSAKIAADVLTAADIAPNAVTNSEMADDAVGVAELSATGTAGTTTFLRGDNTWTVVDTEGTGIKSTGESGAAKFLREDGDGTSSWQTAGSPSIDDGGNATAITIDSSESVTLAGTLAVTNPTSLTSLKPVSNQNLTGTYSDHEMIIGDQFTLTGDLNINDNLVLASLSGSGQDITITDDGNGRTITTAGKVLSCTTTNTDATVTTASTADLRAGKGVTGTGVPAGATIASVTNATTFELSAAATAAGTVNLTFDTGVFEAGEFLGTVPTVPPQTDIADMTSGVMNSAITGSPNLNLSNAIFPAGHVIQTKFVNSNPAFGSIGHSTPFHLSTLDITLTTKAANSIFSISAQYASDDTNSSTFGVGIGVYATGAAITDEYWLYPAAHEDYWSVSGDKYIVARHTTAFSPGYAAGITFTLRVYGRFSNSNGQQFLGNGAPYYAQRHLVQEIKG